MMNLAIAPIRQDFVPQPAPSVWVTWAEGIAGPATLAPRGVSLLSGLLPGLQRSVSGAKGGNDAA
jgi:hypothetical protein